MPGWVPFTGLTAVAVLLLLGLARLSQRAISEQPALPDGSDTAGNDTDINTTSDASAADTPTPGEPVVNDMETVTVSGTIDAQTGPSQSDDLSPAEPSSDESSSSGPRQVSTGALLANVALTQGLFGVLLAGGVWYYEIPLSAVGLTETAIGSGPLTVGIGIVFGVVLWTANEISASVADAVGATYDESLRGKLAPDSIPGWLLLLGVILPTIAAVEELLFRAALIGVPAAGFEISALALAIFSSALFAMGHGAQGKVGIVVTGGLGFVLAGGYVLSGSLLVVVIAHYLVNALEFVVHEGIGAGRV